MTYKVASLSATYEDDSDAWQENTAYGELSNAEVRAALAEREGFGVEIILENLFESKPTAPIDLAPSDEELHAKISQRAYTLIIDLETGGRRYYEARRGINKRPHWPGARSGVTIGCGYDLGYHTQAEFDAAWRDHLEPKHVSLLTGAIGKKGTSARNYMPRVKHIVIDWGEALAVFDKVTMPKYTRLMLSYLPTAVELHPHCFGALVSLVFNRGASFRLAGDRYREMREIHRLMAARNFEPIPSQIESMKRLWRGRGLKGLLIRRDKEADLFQDGLDAMKVAAQPAEMRERIKVVDASYEGALEAVAAEADPELEWLEQLTQDQLDDMLYEAERGDQDSVAEFGMGLEAAARRYRKSDVRWVNNDDNHPDYTHLPPDAKSRVFGFTADDLENLIRRNRFAPHFGTHNRMIFALRGAALDGSTHAQEEETELHLVDVRPNHRRFRCVIGIYDRNSRKLSAYTGSTVCNAGAVVACYNYYNGFSRTKQGNILPTGCYELCVGTHYGKKVKVPGVFRLGNGPNPADASKATVLRSANDVTYGTQDIWDPCIPKDNLHPAFRTDRFSSLGCLTVRGTYSGRGRHKGEWAKFRTAAGLDSGLGRGTRFDMVLMTGLDAATASHLRTQAITDEQTLDEAVGCLRHGSQGPLVEKLQAKLAIQANGKFDWRMTEALAKHQNRTLGWASGTYGRNMDALLGFDIFGSAVIA